MIRERSWKPAGKVAPDILAEDAITRSMEQEWPLAEGIAEVDPELRHEMIATAAYFIAEQRGFVPGHEAQDWYAAEAAIDKELRHVLGGE